MNNTILSVRTDKRLKNSVGKTLHELGLNHSTAINIFYHAIEKYHGLPFPIKLPNKETISAVNELKNEKGTVYESTEDFFKEMSL